MRWLGESVTQAMPVFGAEPELTVELPRAWWVPSTALQAIERLRLHGVRVEPVAASRRVELDMVRLSNVKLGAPSEGHVPLTAEFRHEGRTVTMPPGSVRVPSDQPLALVAAALLEAESPDSLLA